MRHFGDSWPPIVGDLVGTIPIVTTLRTETFVMHIGSIDVFEGAANMLVLITLQDGVHAPVVKIPEEVRNQMLEAQVQARITSETDGASHHLETDRPLHPEIPSEQPAHLELRIRITDDTGRWLHSMPLGMRHDLVTYRGDYQFPVDLRKVGSNPRLMIEPMTWHKMFEPRDYQNVPEFEPQWSIPIDLNSLVPAKEIDAR